MKNVSKSIVTLSLLAGAACAPQNSTTIGAQPLETRTNANSDITLNTAKIGDISRMVVSSNDLEKEKERRRATSLLPMPVDPSNNASVFKVSGLAGESQYLVSPRVFVYGSKVNTLAKTEDGKVVIPFNIAIIDGFNTHLHSEEISGHSLEIPESLRVKNYSSLRQELALKEGFAPERFSVGALPGCPSRITIVAAGNYYDVTPKDFREADYCELNKPFTVNLKVPESTARFILNEALRTSTVDVMVNYAVMTPVPVSQLSVRFDKSKLFDAIHMNLQALYPPYGQAEVELAIEKVMKSSHMNVTIQGDYNEQMQMIVRRAIEEFFVPYKADPQIPGPRKCESVVCLDVKKFIQSHNEQFVVEWTQTENMKMEKVIRIGSKLKPVNDEVTTIGRDAAAGSAGAAFFTNKNSNTQTNPQNIYSVGITPQQGNVVEFEPTLYSWERRSRDAEVILNSRRWEDCTGRVGIENRCSYTTRLESLLTKEFTGEEMWVNVRNPMSSVPRLINGLHVYFRFANGESIICGLDTLEGGNSNGKRIIKIENTPLCPVFDKDRTVVTDFGLINSTALDNITYTAGQKFSTNYGRDWSTYQTVTYTPEVRIAGTLRLIGMAFISLTEIK